MKTLRILLASVIAALTLSACSHEEYDKMPNEIATFVSKYWPDPNIESCTNPGGESWVIIIKNGPTLTFNSSCDWTSINGNGLPLPSIVMFDQLPPKLYDYLESGEFLSQTFSIVRTPRMYTVTLLTQTVTYDIATETIRQETTSPV